MKKILIFCICCLQLAASAQNYKTSADIYLGLKKLNVLGSVLYIAAHPDDENTRLITYFSKDKLYRTGYLSMTRGDGGQNLIGNEQGVELGLIRTQELLAARRIDGGEQFFTRAFDFGYSKTPEETFSKWDKEKILSDVVWVIRKFQPDVIITRFPTTGEGGHGHHTGSAILANEAFQAAADPKRFPEQLKYVKVWQAKRILWNGFNFNNATIPADAFKIDVGGYNPVLGKSYGEIAAESRSQHKSQGFGSSSNRGESFEFFRTTGGTEPVQDLFDGVETGWSRIGAPHISKMVDRITASFDFLHPEKSLKDLVNLLKAVKSLPEGYWRTQKIKEITALVEACSGLFVDATTSVPYVAQSDSVRINISMNNRLGADVKLGRVTLDNLDSSFNLRLPKNKNEFVTKTIFVPASKKVTQPYWLEHEMKEGYFDVRDQQLIGQPDVEPAFVVSMQFTIEGENFVIQRPVRYRFNDPVRGEVYQPFVVVPPYTLEQVPLVVGYKQKQSLERTYKAYRNKVQVNAIASLDKRIDSFGLDRNQVRRLNDPINFDSPVTGKGGMADGTYEEVNRYTDRSTGEIIKQMVTIEYDHIPTVRYFKESRTVLKNFNLETKGKKIGYIVGAGDKVPDALMQMGYEVTMLDEQALSRNHLAQFDAIISGVRAYNTNEWLNSYYDKLMDYVKQGGNLIVQYNTSSNIGPVRAKIGPYPFEISRTRVTNEQSPVTFLHPDHPVLNFPNKITEDDFKGWIQERSIYHAAKIDTAFSAILHMNDPDEKGDDGSLIIAKYGKGYFTYTGIVFFRQLPAGVSGAYRLMANLIALNQKKEF